MNLFTTILFAAVASTTANPVPEPKEPIPTPKCLTSEYRQFDFWIGSWNVTNTKDGTAAGKSLIEKLYDGCTIRENWSEPHFSGGSLNIYNAIDQQWHQTWTDSQGSWREFVGGLADGKMVLVWSHPSRKEPGITVRERMTFTPNADGSVRQYSDESKDGVVWIERYDYTYRRRGK